MRRRVGTVLLALALAGAACESGPAPSSRLGSGSTRPVPRVVYVAVGGDETFGASLPSDDRLREVWPQLLYRRALPQHAVFYNLGQPGGLTEATLPGVLDLVDELRPTLATLWSTSLDEAQVADVLGHLRRAGATRVLVAATSDGVARIAAAEGATVVEVDGAPVSPGDHRAVAAAFANALRGAKR